MPTNLIYLYKMTGSYIQEVETLYLVSENENNEF